MLREHLQVPGMGRTAASYFRDKLAMRIKARSLAIPVPEFSPVFNDQALDDWTRRVPAPWVLKPRSSAAAIGIKKVADRDELWRALDAAGDQRSNSVLEQFVSGDVYHVDSIIWDGKVVFAVPFKYGRPPMEIAHQGGLFITRRLPDDSPEGAALLALNRRLQEGLGLQRGVSHTRIHRPRRQIRGACLSRNLRASRRRVHRRHDRGRDRTQPVAKNGRRSKPSAQSAEYTVPPHRDDYAGIVLSLARQEHPDMSAYTDAEIVTRLEKAHHAGLIVRSPDPRAHRRADRRLHAALLPRLLRHRAAAGPSGRMT